MVPGALEALGSLTLSKQPSLKPRDFWNMRSNRCDVWWSLSVLGYSQWPLSYGRLLPLSKQGTWLCQVSQVSSGKPKAQKGLPFVDVTYFLAYTWTCFTLNPNLRLFCFHPGKHCFLGLFLLSQCCAVALGHAYCVCGDSPRPYVTQYFSIIFRISAGF